MYRTTLFLLFSYPVFLLAQQAPGAEISNGAPIYKGDMGNLNLEFPSDSNKLLLDAYDIQSFNTADSTYCGTLFLQYLGGSIDLANGGGITTIGGNVILADSLAFGNHSVQTRASSEIAFGTIDLNGNVLSGSGNFNCIWNAALSQYEITINGEHYDWQEYTTMVTPALLQNNFAVSSGGGKLIVTFVNGGLLTQNRFQFVTHQNITKDLLNHDDCPNFIIVENQAENTGTKELSTHTRQRINR